MGISERREAEKEALRGKIFEGASKLIIESGYEKLSIRKLANEIEYSPAMIYNYFKNKDDILKAITIDNYDRIVRELLCIDFKSMTPKIALKTALVTLIQLLLNKREQFRATLLSGVNTIDEKHNDNEAINLLVNMLNKGVSSDDFVIADTKVTAVLIVTSIFGVVAMIVLSKIYDENIISATTNAYVELIVNGVSRK